MLKKLSLSNKLILLLVSMQVLVLTLGAFFISAKVEKTILRSIDETIDGNLDVLEEETRITANNKIQLNLNKDYLQELNVSENDYFELRLLDETLIKASSGPRLNTRKKLHNAMSSLTFKQDKVKTFYIDGNQWRIIKEEIGSEDDEDLSSDNNINAPKAFLYIARNAAPALSEFLMIKYYFIIGIIILIIITSICTTLIVSHSTNNIRAMADSLKKLKPEEPIWDIHLSPQSAEEYILFQSFKELSYKLKVYIDSQRLFISNASHELKTPVASILTALEVLLIKKRDANVYEETCLSVLSEVKILKHLTETLLDVARIQNKQIVTDDIIYLSVILDNLKQRWQLEAEKNNVILKIIKPDHDNEIKTNIEYLLIALGNFIENSIKYSRDKSPIVEISAYVKQKYNVFFQIKDNGIGLSKDQINKLGDLFFRVSESRPNDQSYGLGFSHAKQIIKALNGSINIKSELHKGTVITVHLSDVIEIDS